jgi:PTH1 family peptidyl-tRNA hydrolase
MKAIVGLGNPGAEYQGNRHNIGFMAVDALAGSTGFKNKFHGQMAEISINGSKCLLLKPLTYMNRSGISVGELCNFYKITPADCLVIHDELDIPPGSLRTKFGGSNAGHNGLKDIDRAIGPDYWRLRVGIGHPGMSAMVSSYVLSDFSAAEKKQLPDIIATATKVAEIFCHGSGTEFQQKASAVIAAVKNIK